MKRWLILRPLTVFVGPSNTGKSYLAILIYALHRYFSQDLQWFGRWAFSGRLHWDDEAKQKLDRIDFDALVNQIQRTSGCDSSPDKMTMTVSGPFADLLRYVMDTQGRALGRELLRCFGASSDNIGFLIRKRQRDASIVLRRHLSSEPNLLEHKLTLTQHAINFSADVPEGMLMEIDRGQLGEIAAYGHRLKSGYGGLLSMVPEMPLYDLVLSHIASPLHFPAFYLPADRTGVMHAHRAVVSALIANAPTAGLRPAPQVAPFSGVLADFLQQLIEIGQPVLREKGFLSEHGSRIEKNILGGSVRVTRAAVSGYPDFTYQPEGWKDDLPLMNASSMVSEIAPIVLYLQHMVKPGSVLIVEEPESHLHPAMQVEFTRQLVALVKAGVRVIVTTHSEWVLEELANIVRRAALPEAQRKAHADGRNIALNSKSVGAWLFKPRRHPKGSVVSEIQIDDTGLYPTGFDDVAAALHNEWAEISGRTEDDS